MIKINILNIIYSFISLYIFVGIIMIWDLYSKNKKLKKLLCITILKHNLNNDLKLPIPNFINKEYINLLIKTDNKRKNKIGVKNK